jgi:nucleotide-binding universal stress UspA family protein
MDIHKILCAVDFSEPSKAALQSAADLAKRFDAKLVVLHVYHMPIYPLPEGAIMPTGAELSALFAEIDRGLEGWKRDVTQRGVREVETISADGVPWRTIVSRAQECAADLIVVGTHGHSGIKHVLLGSVAERVVRHAHCPVLAVR